MKKVFFLFFFCLFLFSCGESPKKDVNSQRNVLPDGETLYLENCASCHGIDGTLGKAGSKDLSKTTMNFVQLKEVVQMGTNNGMPRFKELLGGDEELEAVVQYIMGFKRIE